MITYLAIGTSLTISALFQSKFDISKVSDLAPRYDIPISWATGFQFHVQHNIHLSTLCDAWRGYFSFQDCRFLLHVLDWCFTHVCMFLFPWSSIFPFYHTHWFILIYIDNGLFRKSFILGSRIHYNVGLCLEPSEWTCPYELLWPFSFSRSLSPMGFVWFLIHFGEFDSRRPVGYRRWSYLLLSGNSMPTTVWF